MDTGLNDCTPGGTQPTYLQDTEVAWLTDKVRNAGRRSTVLPSHHQLFTAYEDIGGGSLNTRLRGQLAPLLPSVHLWLWGHEHDLVVYGRYQNVLARCIGHGAFPVGIHTPHAVKFPEVPIVECPSLGNSGATAMPNWMTGTCQAGDATLYYRRTGGAGPAVVLLHGLTGSGACWGPLARSLEGEFDVVMPDARGHGQSSAPLHGYAYDDHARDVISLIRELRLVAPILLGHSMGGMTAALAASRLGQQVSAVILADPTFLEPQRQREVRDSDVAEQHRRALSLSKRELLAEMHRRYPQRSAEILEGLVEARLQTRMSTFDVLTPPNPEYRELVSRIEVPILLVIGSAPVVSLAIADELQSLNPRVRVEQIQNAGHGLHYDQPERFATVVRSFLENQL